MRTINITILCLFLAISAFSQTDNKKIKVILLGTFHYGATSDRNSTSFKDLYTSKRQKELDSIASYLAVQKVSKIFIEREPEQQAEFDSLFSLYRNGKLTDTNQIRLEEIQVGFRTAKKLLIPLVAVDYKQELPYDSLMKYDKEHPNDTPSVNSIFHAPYPLTRPGIKLSKTSLLDYYVKLNDPYHRQQNLFDYLHYALSSGIQNEYPGKYFTAVYYDRNLKIFNNILRNIDMQKDETIVVLFGASHTAFLRQFFENHPYFQIVELETVFKR